MLRLTYYIAASALIAQLAHSVFCLPVVNTNITDASPCFVSGVKYLHSQQIERDDPCEFCLCLDGDVFCWWQQQCAGPLQHNFTQPSHQPPPTHNYTSVEDEDWDGSSWDAGVEHNSTESLGPPTSQATPTSCTVMGVEYKVGEVLPRETGTCLQCECAPGARVTCAPKDCTSPDAQGFHSLDQQSLDMFDVDLF